MWRCPCLLIGGAGQLVLGRDGPGDLRKCSGFIDKRDLFVGYEGMRQEGSGHAFFGRSLEFDADRIEVIEVSRAWPSPFSTSAAAFPCAQLIGRTPFRPALFEGASSQTTYPCFKCKGRGWRCSACNLTGKSVPLTVVHGTTEAGADGIRQTGFDLSVGKGEDNMSVSGLYVTREHSKAMVFAQGKAERMKSPPVVMTLVVDCGRCKNHDASACKGGHVPVGCDCRKWKAEGYDSQFIAAGKGVEREEIVLKSSDQVISITQVTPVSD